MDASPSEKSAMAVSLAALLCHSCESEISAENLGAVVKASGNFHLDLIHEYTD